MNLSLSSMGCDVDINELTVPFLTELELVDKFERLFDTNQNNSVLIEREFNCGYGIADAVIFKYRKSSALLDLSMIHPEWAYTLKSLPYRKNFNLDTLMDLSGASSDASKKAMKGFINAGYCKEIKKSIYIKVRQPKLLCSSIIAVEAKLRDWKKAIWQATRYRIFSNQSWVLLDQSYSNSAVTNIQEFKKYNIGLATFSTSGCYRVYFSPQKENHRSEIALWKANAFLAKNLVG